MRVSSTCSAVSLMFSTPMYPWGATTTALPRTTPAAHTAMPIRIPTERNGISRKFPEDSNCACVSAHDSARVPLDDFEGSIQHRSTESAADDVETLSRSVLCYVIGSGCRFINGDRAQFLND
jgi:hypothetical protein